MTTYEEPLPPQEVTMPLSVFEEKLAASRFDGYSEGYDAGYDAALDQMDEEVDEARSEEKITQMKLEPHCCIDDDEDADER